MCDNIVIHSHRENFPDRICETQGELAFIIGKENMVYDADYSSDELRPGDCLCAINMKKTAEKAGYNCDRLDSDGEYDAFDFHWRKK